MTLETELRAALHERASRVPAATHLTQIDYHPRTRRLRPPVAIGGGLAGAAGTAAVVLSLTSGATEAFAGWSQTPTTPSPAQLAMANVDCRSQSPIAGLPLKLTDTRGPFTFEVYANDQSSAICTTGPSFQSASGMMAGGPVTVPADQLQLSTSHLTNRDGQAYSFADGRAGADVTGATLVLDDGTQVQATVQNGWFVAWWPTPHEVKTADLTTTTGTSTQTFDTNNESPCGKNLCTGGGFSANSSGPVTGAARGSLTESLTTSH
jgi:hypothetical protein